MRRVNRSTGGGKEELSLALSLTNSIRTNRVKIRFCPYEPGTSISQTTFHKAEVGRTCDRQPHSQHYGTNRVWLTGIDALLLRRIGLNRGHLDYYLYLRHHAVLPDSSQPWSRHGRSFHTPLARLTDTDDFIPDNFDGRATWNKSPLTFRRDPKGENVWLHRMYTWRTVPTPTLLQSYVGRNRKLNASGPQIADVTVFPKTARSVSLVRGDRSTHYHAWVWVFLCSSPGRF